MSKKCNVVCEDYVSLLLDSYQIMHDQNEVIFFKMYERLISIDSDYAKLFSSTNISKQIYMFRHILLNIPIMLAEDIPRLIEKLEALGKKHKNIGVVYKHYPIMQNVLLSIMKETNLFTEDHIDAWRWVFDFITHYMTDITNTE